MKFNIENYLYKIDNSFSQKSKKDIYLIYIMVFAVIFGLSYILLFDSSKQSLQASNKKVTQIQTLINADKRYLAQNSQNVLANLNNRISGLKLQYIKYKKDNSYIKYKISQISSLFYNQTTWGNFLNSISLDAKQDNIKLLKYSNNFIKHGISFGHVLNINIKARGNYKNTLKFINTLEKSFLVVDVHNIDMKAKEKLYTDLNISVWGIKQ